MTKLYRLVPDTITSIMLTRNNRQIMEDLFYKQGILDAYCYNYFGLYKVGFGKVEENSNGEMFFFTSPWSCIKGHEFMRDYYGGSQNRNGFVARILEYDIPDDILTASSDVFTNYSTYQGKGKLVPMRLLQGTHIPHKEIDEELRLKLERQAFEDAKETLMALKSIFPSPRIDIPSEDMADDWEYLIKKRFSLKEREKFFESDTITGRTMLITREDFELLMDVSFGKRPEEDLQSLMTKSDGILTSENLKEYDSDVATHRYGAILF